MDKFIDRLLKDQQCCCGHDLDRSCVVGVGLPCNEPPQPLRGQNATAAVIVRCPKCGEFHYHTLTVPGEILHAYLSRQNKELKPSATKPAKGKLPDWLESLLVQLICPQCHRQTGRESLAGVAYAATEHPLPSGRIATTYLLMMCSHCGYRYMAGTPAGLEAMREAAEAIQDYLYHQIAREMTGCESDGNVATEPSASEPQSLHPVRPSIRRSHPHTPITDKEVRRFLNLLNRTSFRRSSKSFKRWQQRMGIDGW